MSARPNLTWQLHAWAALLRRALTYPAMPRRDRAALLAAVKAADGTYLSSVRADVFAEGADDSDTITLGALETRDHNCSVIELFVLAMISRHVQPARALEIGTHDGRSALAIAMNAPADCQLFTLNLPPDYVETTKTINDDALLSTKVVSGERFIDHRSGRTIIQLFGESSVFDFTPYAPCQMVFIDGAHDTATAAKDTENALRLIDRDNGAVVWHDATSYGVRRVTQRLVSQGYPLRLVAGTDIAVLRFEGGAPVELAERA